MNGCWRTIQTGPISRASHPSSAENYFRIPCLSACACVFVFWRVRCFPPHLNCQALLRIKHTHTDQIVCPRSLLGKENDKLSLETTKTAEIETCLAQSERHGFCTVTLVIKTVMVEKPPHYKNTQETLV